MNSHPRQLAYVVVLGGLLCFTGLDGSNVAAEGKAFGQYRLIPAGTLRTVMPPDGKQADAQVPPFMLQTRPVTNAEYAQFVARHPQWQRDKTPRIFADAQYLQHWPNDRSVSASQSMQPVTNLSWFAAQAYCESEGARLPSWYEWEYVAAADEKRADARSDPEWRERILNWYSQASADLPRSGAGHENYYGVRDMHGLVWEWVSDAGALMTSSDSRKQGDPEQQQFCGAGAIAVNDRDNYAVLMRLAMLSSLTAISTNRNLGFRCAKDVAIKKTASNSRKP